MGRRKAARDPRHVTRYTHRFGFPAMKRPVKKPSLFFDGLFLVDFFRLSMKRRRQRASEARRRLISLRFVDRALPLANMVVIRREPSAHYTARVRAKALSHRKYESSP